MSEVTMQARDRLEELAELLRAGVPERTALLKIYGEDGSLADDLVGVLETLDMALGDI